MSSHRRSTQNFSRGFGPRKALIRGLMESLVEHGRITTTVDRAKVVRRQIEKAITVGKKGDVAAIRLLLRKLPSQKAVKMIVSDLSVRFKTRPGGYTRIIRIGRRPGDQAEMAFLEFVDFDYKTKESKEPANDKEASADKKAKTAKAAPKAKKASAGKATAKKRTAKKSQKKARKASRG